MYRYFRSCTGEPSAYMIFSSLYIHKRYTKDKRCHYLKMQKDFKKPCTAGRRLFDVYRSWNVRWCTPSTSGTIFLTMIAAFVPHLGNAQLLFSAALQQRGARARHAKTADAGQEEEVARQDMPGIYFREAEGDAARRLFRGRHRRTAHQHGRLPTARIHASDMRKELR